MTEADLCAAFIAEATKPHRSRKSKWTAYPETAGFDLLLVRDPDGVQIGIEAKLTLNTKVITQALPYRERWIYAAEPGPDYRAVLVPFGKGNGELGVICRALGITVIRFHTETPEGVRWAEPFRPYLPCEEGVYGFDNDDWHEWAPAERCKLPDYVPDVSAGCASPIALTDWKVRAIKLAILLEDRPLTRADFKRFKVSPTLWLCPGGWLVRSSEGWVRGPRTPDFRAQHPINYEQIRTDRLKWDQN